MGLISKEEVYFLKLRTLPKRSLEKLCIRQVIAFKGNIADLINRVFTAKVSESIIDRFIKEEYLEKRQKERESKGITHNAVTKELNKVESHIWGMVQGELDAYIQSNFVRAYYKYEDLIKAIRKDLYPSSTSYVLCTWYNYWSTVIIEDLIAQHSKVIPTVNKVKDTDIFWLGQPWDIKNTNLPREWFKDGYTIEDAIKNPIEAARYLYQLQGAQRFGANNRLFLIIADTKRPEETWKLKRDFSLIKDAIDDFFNTVTKINTINFVFDKKPYVAHAKILFIVK